MFIVIITPKDKNVVLDRNALDCFHQSYYPPKDKSYFKNRTVKEAFDIDGKAEILFNNEEEGKIFVERFEKNNGLSFFNIETILSHE